MSTTDLFIHIMAWATIALCAANAIRWSIVALKASAAIRNPNYNLWSIVNGIELKPMIGYRKAVLWALATIPAVAWLIAYAQTN